jgi:hypothetical protein
MARWLNGDHFGPVCVPILSNKDRPDPLSNTHTLSNDEDRVQNDSHIHLLVSAISQNFRPAWHWAILAI